MASSSDSATPKRPASLFCRKAVRSVASEEATVRAARWLRKTHRSCKDDGMSRHDAVDGGGEYLAREEQRSLKAGLGPTFKTKDLESFLRNDII